MSKLKTNTIRHVDGSNDNITLDSSQNVTVEGNATVDGTSTLTGNVTCSGNVGVGTSSPADKFHVVAGSQRNFVVRSTGGEPLLYAQNDSGNVENLTIGGNNVIFKAGSGSTGSEVARISENGGITFNGDTAAANGLDDYEEGTFTPNWRGGSSAGTTTYTANGSHGSYTKVGRIVNVGGYVDIQSATGTGPLLIDNLPFASASGDAYLRTGSFFSNNVNYEDDHKWLVTYASGGTTMKIYAARDGQSWEPHDVSTGAFIWSLTYMSAS